MEPYRKLQEIADSSLNPTHEGTQGIFPQEQANIKYRLPQKLFKVLGSIQIMIGFVSIVLGITGAIVRSGDNGYGFTVNIIGDEYRYSVIGYGIWCGIIFCLNGSFTIVAAVRRRLCWVITCMVMSIIAAVLTLITLGFGTAELISGLVELPDKLPNKDYEYNQHYNDFNYNHNDYMGDYQRLVGYKNYNPDDYTDYYQRWMQAVLAIATGVFMIIGSITEAILAIMCSAITCNKTCCKPRTYQPIGENAEVQPIDGRRIIVLASPQQVPLNV